MAKNKKKIKKKKEKAYYEKEARKNKIVEKNIKKADIFSNTSFMICVGFLIIMYSRYVVMELSSRLVSIFGLGVMGYGVYNYIRVHKGKIINQKGKKEYSKNNLIIDYLMILVILLAIIYNVFMLLKGNIK